MNNLTEQALNVLKNCPQCLDSLREVPCEDYKDSKQLGLAYQARFGAFIRAKCGIITTNLIEWHTVAKELESLL
jgi:hypothetical protein